MSAKTQPVNQPVPGVRPLLVGCRIHVVFFNLFLFNQLSWNKRHISTQLQLMLVLTFLFQLAVFVTTILFVVVVVCFTCTALIVLVYLWTSHVFTPGSKQLHDNIKCTEDKRWRSLQLLSNCMDFDADSGDGNLLLQVWMSSLRPPV